MWYYWLIGWFALGSISFISTQNLINGWDYIKAQPNPLKVILSSILLGPITTFMCIPVILKYLDGQRLPELK